MSRDRHPLEIRSSLSLTAHPRRPKITIRNSRLSPDRYREIVRRCSRERLPKGRRTTAYVVLAAALCLFATSCGGDKLGAAAEPDPPVGVPVLPDLTPKPQFNVLTKRVKGRWHIFFSTFIVNAGEGDFVLRATRLAGPAWHTEQDIQYSQEGAKRVSVPARLIWGGDGHSHWHIARVASTWLVRLDAKGRPVAGEARVGHKIGFCFYDHSHELARGPGEAVYSAHSCGKRDATVVGMGLSQGWDDIYLMTLPGQSIDVTGLSPGKFRLFTAIDEARWFHEVTRKNNRTWIDIELRMTPQGLSAPTIGTGPAPS